MRKFLMCLLTCCLTGCSNYQQSGVHPNISHPERATTTTPTVAFLGDDQIIGLVDYVSNPMWSCTTCAQGQTSTQLLAEVPAVIAQRPNIVPILTGAYDLIEDPQSEQAEPTVANIADMCDQLEKAGVTSLVFFLPESTAYDNYYVNVALYEDNLAGLIPNLLTYPINPDGSYPEYTNGVDFSPAGLAVVYALTYQKIEWFGLGGAR